MPKKIITIGFNIPGYFECFHRYSSDQSLLDADIIIFESDFGDYDTSLDYRGKPSYNENESFRLQEATKRWKTELSIALEEGKTIFVFLANMKKFLFVLEKEIRRFWQKCAVNPLCNLL